MVMMHHCDDCADMLESNTAREASMDGFKFDTDFKRAGIAMTRLVADHSTLGDTSKLDEPFMVSYHGMRILVPPGFETDYASAPPWLGSLIPRVKFPKASVMHDWLYATKLMPKAACDRAFFELLLACAVLAWCAKRPKGLRGRLNWLRAWTYAAVCYGAVRLRGKGAWLGHTLDKVNAARALGGLPHLDKLEHYPPMEHIDLALGSSLSPDSLQVAHTAGLDVRLSSTVALMPPSSQNPPAKARWVLVTVAGQDRPMFLLQP